jgi:transcriptional antiterminator RfaH
MMYWYVVHTHPNKEHLAAEHLWQQGYQVYLPCIRKLRRHARKEEVVLAPLFPRYLFVSFDITTQSWRTINSTRGVSYLVMHDDRPTPLPGKIIETLKAREDATGIIPLETLELFKPGQVVHIQEGAFAGCSAVYERMTDQNRVQILLTFLGRELSVDLPSHALQAAG